MNDSKKYQRKSDRECAKVYFTAALLVAATFTIMAIVMAGLSNIGIEQGIITIEKADVYGCIKTVGLVLFMTIIAPSLAVSGVFCYKSWKD